ncbi:protein translation factor SUI1 homolog isoform X1 [Musa acuminata AAA Group]|uniref:protein translation factor SUI1 homolog isoform X1 n=1 Tax=Musa acuminata AAA Group TaxID=214697 RepID=UPI0031D1AEE4
MSPPSRQYLFCPLSFYLVLGEWTREAHRIHLGFFADKDRWLGLCSRRVRCDPFADANAEDSGAGAKEYVHIRIQQRNGRKSLTTVQGLKKEFSYNKILKDLKKEFCCNGTVVQDPELGQVIQLQGDQRKNVSSFLVQAGIIKKEHIKIHGF